MTDGPTLVVIILISHRLHILKAAIKKAINLVSKIIFLESLRAYYAKYIHTVSLLTNHEDLAMANLNNKRDK